MCAHTTTNDHKHTTMRKIIILEGSHGCGKTALLGELRQRGANVIDEGFLNMPQLGLGPQTHTMEIIWVAEWIKRVLSLPAGVYFADRGLYSAVLYAANGRDMQRTINHMIEEVSSICEIINVYVSVNEDTLWRRITERLKHEPHRQKYHEDKIEQMVRARAFYEYNHSLWQHTVTNNDGEWSECVNAVCKIGDIACEAP